MRIKIERFRIYLPILDSICRQGLEDRHWELISQHLGKECNPTLYPSLNDILDAGIMNIVPDLMEISMAAGKEYDLNIQLKSMHNEWQLIRFTLLPYRNMANTWILSALDDLQTQLDDHIIRTQAIKRSPFISALGNKADEWEEHLALVQNIISLWSELQASWMYLEPIFSSEDIMRQMPVEGRSFKLVDRTWHNIMEYTSHNLHVLNATQYPNILECLQHSLQSLETVQKGLNTYLEQKRISFARFYFLSNDELLEILSETKDPIRVQSYLKKCFEGVSLCSLSFIFKIFDFKSNYFFVIDT